ncbi:Fungal Zn(2)-Cys(6) binuclear cluster domain protein [Ceratocystis lukuohia]|uniref:Fungal Zn(2)-Cys(6) binuclear cluster domain protein n=1 Tax=Ceratocystis lukuohia TaxID=2019550 RepID=A0ABR4MN40_9PEZI
MDIGLPPSKRVCLESNNNLPWPSGSQSHARSRPSLSPAHHQPPQTISSSSSTSHPPPSHSHSHSHSHPHPHSHPHHPHSTPVQHSSSHQHLPPPPHHNHGHPHSVTPSSAHHPQQQPPTSSSQAQYYHSRQPEQSPGPQQPSHQPSHSASPSNSGPSHHTPPPTQGVPPLHPGPLSLSTHLNPATSPHGLSGHHSSQSPYQSQSAHPHHGTPLGPSSHHIPSPIKSEGRQPSKLVGHQHQHHSDDTHSSAHRDLSQQTSLPPSSQQQQPQQSASNQGHHNQQPLHQYTAIKDTHRSSAPPMPPTAPQYIPPHFQDDRGQPPQPQQQSQQLVQMQQPPSSQQQQSQSQMHLQQSQQQQQQRMDSMPPPTPVTGPPQSLPGVGAMQPATMPPHLASYEDPRRQQQPSFHGHQPGPPGSHHDAYRSSHQAFAPQNPMIHPMPYPESYAPEFTVQSTVTGKRKANRASQACDSCRTLKAKCDETKPCKNCKEKGLECKYRDPVPKAADKVQTDILEGIQSIRDMITSMSEKATKTDNELRVIKKYLTRRDPGIDFKKEDDQDNDLMELDEPAPPGRRESEHRLDERLPSTQPNARRNGQSEPAPTTRDVPNEMTSTVKIRPSPPPFSLDPKLEGPADDENNTSQDDEVEAEPGPVVRPGEPSIPPDHTTGAGHLLDWPAIKEIVADILPEVKVKFTSEYPIRQEEARGILRIHGRGEGRDTGVPSNRNNIPVANASGDQNDNSSLNAGTPNPGINSNGNTATKSYAAGNSTRNLGISVSINTNTNAGTSTPGNSSAIDQGSFEYDDGDYELDSPNDDRWGYAGPPSPMNSFDGSHLTPRSPNAHILGSMDLEPETMVKMACSFIENILNMHPIVHVTEIRMMMQVFLDTLPKVPSSAHHVAQSMEDRSMANTPTGTESVSGGTKRKRVDQKAVIGGKEIQFHLEVPIQPRYGRPARTISNGLVLVILALGKICLSRDYIHDFVPGDVAGPVTATSPSITRNDHLSGAGCQQSSPSETSSDHRAAGSPANGSFRRASAATPAGKANTSPTRNMDAIPGLDYFAMALDIIGSQMGGNTLKHVQANVFAGLYFGQLGRVIESHAYIAAGSTILLNIMRPSFNRMRELKAGSKFPTKLRDNQLIFTFWTCLQLESDIVAELPRQQSGILAYDGTLPYPNLMLITDPELGPFSDPVFESYMAQLYLRRHLNQIHRMFYGPNAKPALDPNSDFYDVKTAQSRVGDMLWVGPNFKFDEDDPPAGDILTARLRAKYWGAQVITYRPFVKQILDFGVNRRRGQTYYPVNEFRPDIQAPTIHPTTSSYEGIDEQIKLYAQRGIRALVESTQAFHNLGDERPIITNVFGTAHAQWGNMLVLAACYRDSFLSKHVDPENLLILMDKTLAFLHQSACSTSALAIDRRILKHVRHMIFGEAPPTSRDMILATRKMNLAVMNASTGRRHDWMPKESATSGRPPPKQGFVMFSGFDGSVRILEPSQITGGRLFMDGNQIMDGDHSLNGSLTMNGSQFLNASFLIDGSHFRDGIITMDGSQIIINSQNIGDGQMMSVEQIMNPNVMMNSNMDMGGNMNMNMAPNMNMNGSMDMGSRQMPNGQIMNVNPNMNINSAMSMSPSMGVNMSINSHPHTSMNADPNMMPMGSLGQGMHHSFGQS